jgi:hypothetical protein
MNNDIPPIIELKPGRSKRRITSKWRKLTNKSAAEKLSCNMTLSVLDEGESIGNGLYKLRRFVEGRDYYDPEHDAYIWSIGRNRATGAILASVTTEFYRNDEYECLFLR